MHRHMFLHGELDDDDDDHTQQVLNTWLRSVNEIFDDSPYRTIVAHADSSDDDSKHEDVFGFHSLVKSLGREFNGVKTQVAVESSSSSEDDEDNDGTSSWLEAITQLGVMSSPEACGRNNTGDSGTSDDEENASSGLDFWLKLIKHEVNGKPNGIIDEREEENTEEKLSATEKYRFETDRADRRNLNGPEKPEPHLAQNIMPAHWGRSIFQKNYEEIILKIDSNEFQIISDLLNKTIKSHGSNFGLVNGKDPSQFISIQIRRIYNKRLWHEYTFKKNLIMDKNSHSIKQCYSSKYIQCRPFMTPLLDENANEYWLFHGSRKDIVPILIEKGYDPRVSSIDGMFGGGFYLAENSSKANQYIPCPQCGNNAIFSRGQCTCKEQDNIIFSLIIYRAVLGDIHIATQYDSNKYKRNGKNPVRRPPQKEDSDDLHDSVLGESKEHGGDTLNYREVILYDSGQAYPEYVIDFKRSDKPNNSSKNIKSALDACYRFLNS